ncbi:integration host factor subunit beta [Rugosibacter aromaticivorans]|jgi:integration host factor subunit beta|uniref:Integration host factor subunit beta n=1 Tax=Rugosibacter aromaticivorans TaxID=1565605 RepID=A0A0C5J0J8_9PROT|nr:integration host factor subunit beta [Rugosibacter aromaticivorans]AJP48572.1 integration host factor subunit beta [Rugosibacter aromaticivorans]TBR14773.1 MAG: integration host factor subunit beta [Rugosibacter sp.]
MTRSELVERLSRYYPSLTHADISASVSVILDAVTTALANGDRAEIRGFGSFRLNHRPSRIGRNPKTGVTVNVPAKIVPHFKPGLELRERVNLSLEINK